MSKEKIKLLLFADAINDTSKIKLQGSVYMQGGKSRVIRAFQMQIQGVLCDTV